MIDASMKVLVSEDGEETEIGALEVGQQIFNPLTGSRHKIVEIRVRHHHIGKHSSSGSESLTPISIPARQTTSRGKFGEILVSRRQSLLFPEGISGLQRPRLVREVDAQSLVGSFGIRLASEISQISYAAILLDRSGFVAISGRLFKCYDLSSLLNEKSDSKFPTVSTKEMAAKYVN